MRAQDPGSAENGELEDVTQKYNTSCPGTETTAKVRLEKIVQSFGNVQCHFVRVWELGGASEQG